MWGIRVLIPVLIPEKRRKKLLSELHTDYPGVTCGGYGHWKHGSKAAKKAPPLHPWSWQSKSMATYSSALRTL